LVLLDQNILIDDLDDLLRTEESLIHTAYGADGYAADLTHEDDDMEGKHAAPARFTRVATGQAVHLAYRRILATPDVPQLDPADLPLLELMQAANREAFLRWSSLFHDTLGIPTTRNRRAQIDELHEWLLAHYMALRHLFAFLPYPELEAKRWSHDKLATWGAAEVFCEQMRAILRIAGDSSLKPAVREFCSEWHDACMVQDLPKAAAYALAHSPERWDRLKLWIPSSFGRACPLDILDTEWRLLHVLPYVVEDWGRTPMGRAPFEARALRHRHITDPLHHHSGHYGLERRTDIGSVQVGECGGGIFR